MWQPTNNTESFWISDSRGAEAHQYLLRPIHSLDQALILAGFDAMSETTRRHRFFSPIKALSPEAVRCLLDADQDMHVVLVLMDITESRDYPVPVGLVQYQRLLHDKTVAELGIVVVDAYQGRGLGRVMLTALEHKALRSGVTELIAYALLENHAMRSMMESRAAQVYMEPDNVVEYRVRIQARGSFHLRLKACGFDVLPHMTLCTTTLDTTTLGTPTFV